MFNYVVIIIISRSGLGNDVFLILVHDRECFNYYSITAFICEIRTTLSNIILLKIHYIYIIKKGTNSIFKK